MKNVGESQSGFLVCEGLEGQLQPLGSGRSDFLKVFRDSETHTRLQERLHCHPIGFVTSLNSKS